MSHARVSRLGSGCLPFILLFLFWEIADFYHENLRFVLPAPSNILLTMWTHADRFLFHTFITLKEMLGGFLLACAAAFPLAWIMFLFAPVRLTLQPLFVSIQCMPMFALAPIMVLWFGWSYFAIIIPTALMIFFPLTINIYQGLCTTPDVLLEFFRLHQATSWQTFYKLQLPWALPHVFAGFRIAVAFACIGAVAGEWAGAQEGLGLLMLESRRGADIDMMFGALACVTAVSLLLYAGAIYVEKKISKRNRQKFSIGRLAVCMLTLLIFIAGCRQTPPSSQVKLLLDWLPNPNHVPLYVGIEKGFFEKEGIPLKILKVADPSDAIPYLTSKQADLCLTYTSHAMSALAHGVQISPIGILIEKPLNCIIYRKEETIFIPEDLNGKTIGYCSDGHHTGFLQAMLQTREIIPKGLRNVNFDFVSPLATRQVDAIYGAYWNIEIESLKSWGIDVDYFPLIAFGVPSYYELIVIIDQNNSLNTPKFTSSFQKALQKSIDYCVSHPEESFALYIRANPDKSARTKIWEQAAWHKTLPALARYQYIDPLVWEKFADWLITHHLLNAQDRHLVVGAKLANSAPSTP